MSGLRFCGASNSISVASVCIPSRVYRYQINLDQLFWSDLRNDPDTPRSRVGKDILSANLRVFSHAYLWCAACSGMQGDL